MSAGKVREIVLRQRGAADRVAHGHPWIWRESIASGLEGASAGEEAQVIGPDGAAMGRGIVDPTCPIAVRVWTAGREPVDDALWATRTSHAFRLRKTLFNGTRTDAYRLLHGEGDRMPGMVVDRYGSVAVIRSDGPAATARIADLVNALRPQTVGHGIRTLVARTGGKGEVPHLELVAGEPPPDHVKVEEYGVPFVVDLARGQKTGAFLDQRENRRRVGELAKGRRMLNLFAYAGGFSLHAVVGGAIHVTSVDIAAAAHATAQASFRAAGVDPSAHAFVTADVTGFLEAARKRGESWDLVVSDPPSFAPSERALPRALSAYRSLHRACVGVLAPGGLFCAASCSSHVDASTFLSTLDDLALGTRRLVVTELRGAGPDHPTLAAFPEGRYLKFAMLA
jgi:23S rRNA (cytosine1962-C5)-methyltransferase